MTLQVNAISCPGEELDPYGLFCQVLHPTRLRIINNFSELFLAYSQSLKQYTVCVQDNRYFYSGRCCIFEKLRNHAGAATGEIAVNGYIPFFAVSTENVMPSVLTDAGTVRIGPEYQCPFIFQTSNSSISRVIIGVSCTHRYEGRFRSYPFQERTPRSMGASMVGHLQDLALKREPGLYH